MKQKFMKLASFFLAAVLVLSMPVSAFAEEHTHDFKEADLHKAKVATCAEEGAKVDYYYCSVCDKYFESDKTTEVAKENLFIPKSDTHTLVAHEQVNATYEKEGKKAYYSCSVCGKLFSDKEGKNAVSEADLVIAKLTVQSGIVSSNANLKVRNGAGMSYAIVKQLPTGTKVTIYQTVTADNGKKWGKISATEEQWVCMDYVLLTKEAGTTTKPGETKPAEEDGGTNVIATGVVNSSSALKVRSGAGMNNGILSSLTTGTKVNIYEKKAAANGVMWGRIDAKEQKWVCLSYVTITENKTDSGSSDKSNTETIVNDKVLGTGTVSSNMALAIRNGAGITNTKIGTLANGSKVSIYETKQVGGATWGRIDKGESKWVCLAYVKLDGAISGGNTDTKGTNGVVANCSTGVNVRSAAGTNNKLIGTLPVGTRVTVTEQTKVNGVSWGHVEKGWVCMDYIKLDSTNTGTGGNTTTTNPTLMTMSVPGKVKSVEALVLDKVGGKTVLVLEPGTEVTITDRTVSGETVYGKLTVGTVTGWVDMNKIELQSVSGVVSSAQLNVYEQAKTDSKVVTVLGKGANVTVTSQIVDGTYVWGKIEQGYVQLNNVTLTIKKADNASSTASISMTGKVNKEFMSIRKEASDSAQVLVKLVRDSAVTILDWKYDGAKTWGKMTFGPFTGWIDLADITQNTVNGTVSATSLNAYTSIGDSKAALTLPNGNAVIIVERRLNGKEVWGRIIVKGVSYWIDLSKVTLGSSGTGSTGTGTGSNTGSTGTGTGTGTGSGTGTGTGTATTSTTGTIANANKVNVRSAAGVGNAIVTTLARGTKVTVYEQKMVNNAAWGRIDQGWVALMYVNLATSGSGSSTVAGGSSTGTTSILTTVPSGALAVGFVDTPELAIRSSASSNATKVGTLKRGTNVVIKEQVLSGGMIWGKIDQGWICTSYVTYTGIGSTGTGTSGLIARCYYTARIRSSAGVGNAVVGNVMVNSKVEIYETKLYSGEQWGRTSLGWISMQYVMTGTAPTV